MKALSYRIVCETLLIESEKYLRSTKKLVLFEDVEFKAIDSTGLFMTTSDKYAFPLEIIDVNYICTATVSGDVSSSANNSQTTMD